MAENFWGIKATTAAIQWPPTMGGQTAAALNNFRIGIKLDANKNKKFDAALGGGAFSLPPFKSKVFEGTLHSEFLGGFRDADHHRHRNL